MPGRHRRAPRRRPGGIAAIAAAAILLISAASTASAASAASATPAAVVPAGTGRFQQLTVSGLRPRLIDVPPKLVRSSSVTRRDGRRYSTLGSGTVAGTSPPLKTWTRSFRWNGTSYRYRMLGSDPRVATTTRLASTIVPVTLRSGGSSHPTGSTVVSTVTRSGLFTRRAFPGGTGQYGDIFLRTQFWSWIGAGRSPWHVVMAPPVVQPALVLDVPVEAGELRTVNGVPVALVDVDWLDAALVPTVRATRPNVLAQVLTTNVIACAPYTPDLSGCGIAGFHSVVVDGNGSHTYTYQSYLNSAVFGASSGFTDIGPMSHELAEWLTDPYLSNRVPAWHSPLAPQYGCTDLLESGDPVVGKFVRISGLTYQDEVYLSWFARSGSISRWGRHTWFNSLTGTSPACTI
jgi:hypothetical protein